MMTHSYRRMAALGLFISVLGFSQQVPIDEPHLIPFPGLRFGISYFSLIPTQNLLIEASPPGWTDQDTLRGVLASFELELLRYRWLDHILESANMDAYSSLDYTLTNQIGNRELPGSYPASFLVNGVGMSGFHMNMAIRSFMLSHHFKYNYSRRGSFMASLGTGLGHLTLYNNSSGVRILESSGLAFELGLGWKYTLLGRPGKRLRLGLDLGYSIRNFDLTDQSKSLSLSDGSAGPVSPIKSISLNTPDLKVSIDFGELLFASYTPYRDPFKLGLLNLTVGFGIINYRNGVTYHLDSTQTSLSIPFLGTISKNYDLQLIKYNWPFHFIRQANIDVFSGVGIRSWKIFQNADLPEGWARDLTDGSAEFSAMRFAPKIFDIYLNHEVLYPLGPNLYIKARGGTGFATLTLYENNLLDRLIDANGLTWQVGTGVGYTVKGDGSSRVSFGLNVDYYHQAFEIDMSASNLSAVNPGEIIPITYLNLSQPVYSFSIGLMFGGYPNAAKKAHDAFLAKRYSKALELQQELLNLNPTHHNKKAILIEKQMVEDSLVTRYYHDVRTILSQGKIENAFALIQQGDTPPGVDVERGVREMKIEIADRALILVSEALKVLDYERAEDMILLALKSDPATYQIAQVLLARSYIIRATILYGSGVYGRSLYWLKQADGLTDRYSMITNKLRQKIGDGKLDDANEGILKEDRQMVYESMQDAKFLNPILSEVVDEHLKDLEAAMKYADEQQIAPLKRMAIDNLLEDVAGLDPENFVPRIGMKGSLIARYIGQPQRKFHEGEYELYIYPKSKEVEVWLYLRDGVIERIEYPKK